MTHQIQKRSFIRCVKCVKFLQHVTISLHFWHGTNSNGICTLLFFYSSLSLIPLWATPSPLLRILLSLLPLCLITLSLVKDGFRCGYILAWAPAWVRWRCGSWVWWRGGSRQAGLWRGGSWTHGRGEWVFMGGFRWGLGWFPSSFFFPAFSSLFDLSSCVWCGFCFWVCLIFHADFSDCVCVCVFFIYLLFFFFKEVAGRCCWGSGGWWLFLRQWWMCRCCCWWWWKGEYNILF